jgi:hypothetical protein
MRNIAINQYKNVKSTLKIPNNLIIYWNSRCVFKMEQLIEKWDKVILMCSETVPKLD